MASQLVRNNVKLEEYLTNFTLTDVTAIEGFSTLEPTDLHPSASSFEVAGLDWVDFIDTDDLYV